MTIGLDRLADGLSTGSGSGITVQPTGGISSTNVQTALAELDIKKAPKSSPVFTGNPTAPTQLANDNSTKLATTAYADASGGGGGGTGAAVIKKYNTTGNGVKTVFAAVDFAPAGFLYITTNNSLELFISGVYQETTAFTATSSTSITFANAVPNGAVIEARVTSSAGITSASARVGYSSLGTGVKTVFTVADFSPINFAYSNGFNSIDVYVGAVYQDPANYTETDANTITFITPPPLNTVVYIVVIGPIVFADTLPRAEKGANNGVASLNVNGEVVEPQSGAAIEIGAGRSGSYRRADGTWTSPREVVNGVAGLDANIEVIKPQAGAAAEVALGRTGARKRADGTWDGVSILLPTGYDLHLWSDGLVSGQIYNVNNPVNAPSSGWWYVEVLRAYSDSAGNPYRVLRLTVMTSAPYPNGTVFTAAESFGSWSAWERADGQIAACTFSVAAGVLTIHKMHGFATFTRSQVGIFPFTFTIPAPDVYWRIAVEHTIQSTYTGKGEYIRGATRTTNGGQLWFSENNLLTDPSNSWSVSSIVIFR